MPKFIRRLQKIGSSILVSLPKEWVDANNLVKNQEVEIDTAQDSLSIAANKETRPSKEVKIFYPLPKEENIVAHLTGAYLLGYDIIKIESKINISIEDREKIRNSMRRLVGMEIVEEDASTINMQFLLDATSLNPQKILKRMNTIVLGMFDDLLKALIIQDRSALSTLSNRDDEVDRQYFLLVRLIRSTMVDKKLANVFHLENIDILDYRIAANLLEGAGDVIVDLSQVIYNTSINKKDLKKIYSIVKDFEKIGKTSIDAFIQSDRSLAIEAIALHKKFKNNIASSRSSFGSKQIPLDYLDLLYMFERVERFYADIADLIKPVYLN